MRLHWGIMSQLHYTPFSASTHISQGKFPLQGKLNYGEGLAEPRHARGSGPLGNVYRCTPRGIDGIGYCSRRGNQGFTDWLMTALAE
jgi:hypothetical protein